MKDIKTVYKIFLSKGVSLIFVIIILSLILSLLIISLYLKLMIPLWLISLVLFYDFARRNIEVYLK